MHIAIYFMARVTYKRSATRVLRRMDKTTQRRIADALDKLQEDPVRQDLDIGPVTGTGGFRLRVGNWRVLYDRQERNNDDEDEIIVQAIRPRGQAYRK